MKGIQLKELSYYLFFGLMIAAKGIGLDSGDRLYYLLSAAAFLCIACKLCMTRYTWKEAALAGALCLLSLITWRNSGRLGILLSVLAIVGMKDMDLSKIFRLGLVVYGSSFLLTVLAAGAGLISNPMVVHEKAGIGEIIRWGMGYSTGNVFHISYFIFVVLIIYNLQTAYRIKHLCLLMLGNLLVFAFSLSYTGILVTSFYLVLGLYTAKREQSSAAERFLFYLPLPLCVLFSFVMPFFTDSAIGRKLDALLQARLSFSHYYLANQPVTWFGTRMKEVPYFWVIMDNSYVFILMTYGILVFLLFAAGYAIVIRSYAGSLKGRIRLAVIVSFLLYGIMEQFLANAFMNLSLLFLSEVLYGRQKKEPILKTVRRGKNTADKGKGFRIWIYGAGAAGALCFLGFYIFAEPKPDRIAVPVTALDYVEAQIVLLQTDRLYGDKKELKGIMKQYEALVTDEKLLERALAAASAKAEAENMPGTFSMKQADCKKIAGMLELSLPQYVYESEASDTFRLRLLESDPDWTSEAYAALLAEITEQMQSEMPSIRPGTVEKERIGKSFGTDRIEHMTHKEKYVVEKKGTVLLAETLRNGLLRLLMGAAAGGVGMQGGLLVFSYGKKIKKGQ